MFTLPPVHLCVMQPAGYVHSLGLLDPARYLRHQFRRFGAEVTLAKNRLREDAVNFVFGAHLGFPAEWTERHACVIVNLEPLGDGGANVPPDYLKLLRRTAVCDYHAANVGAYSEDAADVPLLDFRHAPYLAPAEPGVPLEDRPIDLLFFGCMNPRRQTLIERIEATGVTVSLFDAPLFGAERDALIRQAKAVLNIHHYDVSRFEQIRVAHCLSLGTPVVCERGADTQAPDAFEDAVSWFDEAGLERFFATRYARGAWFDEAREQLRRFAAHDPMEGYADLLAFAAGYHRGHAKTKPEGPWQPRQINLGSGKDYRPGWLNIDVIARAEPDVVLDLSQPFELPAEGTTRFGSPVRLEAGTIERVRADNVLEHVADLPALMTRVLELLAPGGDFEIEVPYEKALTAWQDPTHLRAFNENSWLYYTGWFWYLGWFEHRFDIAGSQWLDLQLAPCAKEQAAFMRLVLRKVETTLAERTHARTMQADFGGIPDDLPKDEAEAQTRPVHVTEAAACEAPAC
jgi:hypothetical protein